MLEGGILQHLMETDSKENNQHFSEILFLDDNFQRIGKISMFGDTEVFFKTLCRKLLNEKAKTTYVPVAFHMQLQVGTRKKGVT